jgi:hypothetical protein
MSKATLERGGLPCRRRARVHADLGGPLERESVPGIGKPAVGIGLEDDLCQIADDEPDLLVD